MAAITAHPPMTIQQLAEKLELLPPTQQATVFELVQRLLSKSEKFERSEKKRQLLRTTVWNSEALREVEKAGVAVNAWRIPNC